MFGSNELGEKLCTLGLMSNSKEFGKYMPKHMSSSKGFDKYLPKKVSSPKGLVEHVQVLTNESTSS